MKKKIAIIGTQGVPNKYGGFETLVEFLAEHLSLDFDITVFCSSEIYPEKTKEYKGCKLEYIPLKANGIQSIPYDIISLLKSVKKFDKILILGSSGGLIMPFLSKYKDKFILNFGGLDWKRSKWKYVAKKILKISEKFTIKNSTFLISDNEGIQDYIKKNYKRESFLIAYGGDQAIKVTPTASDFLKYPFLNSRFAFSVARIQKDNNIEMILESFQSNMNMPIIFVGNWNNSPFGKSMKLKFSNNKNIIMLDPIYDQLKLDLIRSNCSVYVHGHSAGGTNPSLVEAMFLKLPILAFASGYNEKTTKNIAKYFKDSTELNLLLQNTPNNQLVEIGEKMKKVADVNYKWELIAKDYAKIFNM